MNSIAIDNRQINQLLGRAMQSDDELLPLIMPEEADTYKKTEQVSSQAAKEEEDDEELDSKSARQALIKALAEDEDSRVAVTLPYVLRGDILTARWLRNQIWWLIMVVAMAFVYVSNRYYAQKQMIHNNHLKEELKETHYDAMARSSQLMRNCRRSIIVDKLSDSNNTLAMPEKQPATVME